MNKLSVDWDSIPFKFKWVAKSHEGYIIAFKKKPEPTDDSWGCYDGILFDSRNVINQKIHWKDSLTQRPD